MPRNPATWEGIDLCDGRYCSLEKLGEGGMGYVYKARDKRMGRFVVIKVPRAEMLVDSQFRKRFVRELQSLVKLEHRHIVAIQDYNQEDKIPYAVMQYLPQGDLDDRRSQDPQDLKKWLKDIASALDFVHKKGYVHRDVKPGNILFDDEGYAYLSDFGIAKVVADSEEDQQGLTKMGFVIGTPDYMAPELHSNKFDGRIDQYALAVTVYELLSGGTPYRGTTPVEIMFAHKTEQAARIPNISAEFNDAILKGMAKDPDQRYASCDKFAKAVLVAMDNKVQSPRQTEPTAIPIIKNVDQSKTRVESPRRSTQVRSSGTATSRQQLQQERKLRKKRKERTIWIAAATGFVLVLIVVLLLAGGSDDQVSKRSKKSSSSQMKSDVTEKEAERLEQQKSEQRATENNQRAEKKTKPTVQPTPPAPVFRQKPYPPETESTSEPDTEPSETEQAEALLNAKGLEEGFNSQWELAELTKAYEETKNATGNQSGSGNETDFQTEFVRQKHHYFNTLREFYKRTKHQQHPASDPTAREAAGYLNSVGQRPFPENTQILQFTLEGGAPVQFQVPSDIPAISLTDKVHREVSTQPSSNPASNEAINEIAGLLRDGYQKLSEDAKVQAALKTVEGNLAEAPAMLKSLGDGHSQPVSIGRGDENDGPETPDRDQDAPNSENNKQQGGKKEAAQPAASFAELKDQLTALEKETKLSMGAFNKGAKEYIKQKKDLVKRIKAGEALYARRAKIQDGIQYPEDKTKFGQETDAKVTKPLQALKVQLQKLSKPDAAQMEGNLSRAEKLLEQIKTTPEYAANQKSIAGLAETIAKYRKGFNVQQAKMAK